MDSGKLPIIVLPPSGSSVSLIKKNVNDKKLKRGNRKAYRKNCFEKFNLASAFYKVILAFGIIIVVFLDNDNIQSNSQFCGITKGRNLSEAAVPDETSSPGLRGAGVAESDEKSDNESTYATSINDSNNSESDNTDLDATKEEESEKVDMPKGNADHDSQENNVYSSQDEHTDDAKLNETQKSDEKNEQDGEQGHNEKKSQEESYDSNSALSANLEHAINTMPNDSLIRSFLHTSLTVPSDDELEDPYREQTQDDVESTQFTQWIDYMKTIVQEMNKSHEHEAFEQLYDSGITKDEQPADSETSKPEQPADSESITHEETADSESIAHEEAADSESITHEETADSESIAHEEAADSESITHEETTDSKTSKPEQPADSETSKFEQDGYPGLHNKMNLEYKMYPRPQKTGLEPLKYAYNLDIIDDNELNSLFNDSKVHSGARSKIHMGPRSNEREVPRNAWDETNDLYKNQASRHPVGFNSNFHGNEEISMEMWNGGSPSSMNRNQGMNSWEYPSTRNQGMNHDQFSSVNRNQGMNSWEYPSTRNQGMNHDQFSSVNRNQGMNSWEYPSTRNQGMNREQHPSMTINEEMLGRQIIDELQSIKENAGEESMWAGLKKSYRPTPRRPADSSFSGLEAFSREKYSRDGGEMHDRVDILEDRPSTSTSSRSRNPMNSYNYMDGPSSGSQSKPPMNSYNYMDSPSSGSQSKPPMNSYNYMDGPSSGIQSKPPMNSLRTNEPHRAGAQKSDQNESPPSISLMFLKKTAKEQGVLENKGAPSQFPQNAGNGFNQQNQMNAQSTINNNQGTVAIRGNREVSEFSVDSKKSTELQIKEMDDHINQRLDELDMHTTPPKLFGIWSEFIAAETKKFMMIEEYALQYSIYLQKRNNLAPESRTKAWWKVHYSMVNKFIKNEKEHVNELKELLKLPTVDTLSFIRFINQKREAWREIQVQFRDEWMAALTYKMNKYAAQDN
ncbi:Plasmodium exported protein (PHIST), unknown function [Plasmodium vinckei lentum]|uniref:Plasmodium RESA N-terminal domain-containing protein n=1 Tax=Plasmodium vinckei lentum TaxID=138297 RepID=A0A6V7SI61_PLAVN|nr:Plasmodium exported protein (PHIST), unknown function [Plasmodium vinckei lentum]